MRALSFGLIILAGGVAAAPARPVAGVVVKVKGTPLLDGKPLKQNAFVYAGSVLETGTGGCAALALVAGSEVRFNENSEGRVEDGAGRQASSVSLKSGQLWVHLLHGKAALEVRTPQGLVSVGAAQADVAAASRTVVKVYEGSAEVSNEHGRRSVAANQQAELTALTEAPRAPTPLLPSDVETWQAACAPKDVTAPQPPGRPTTPTLQIRRKPARPAPTKPAGP